MADYVKVLESGTWADPLVHQALPGSQAAMAQAMDFGLGTPSKEMLKAQQQQMWQKANEIRRSMDAQMHTQEEQKLNLHVGTPQARYAQTKVKHQATPRDSQYQPFLDDIVAEGLLDNADKENFNLGNLASEPVTPMDTPMHDDEGMIGGTTSQYPKGKAAKRKAAKTPVESVYEEHE